MALLHSTGLRNFKLSTGLATAFDTNGAITFWTGTMPARDAANAGTLLATLPLSADAFAAPSAAAVVANAISSDVSVDASGTPVYFCIWDTTQTALASAASATDRRLYGTVTINGGGGDITFDSVTWIAGGTAAMSGFTYTESP